VTNILAGRRHIHFVGVGGIGMSSLARLLHARGFVVSGSDRDPGDQGESLVRLGVGVVAGHAESNVKGADLVVITSAVGVDNPEVSEAQKHGIPVVKRSELLAALMNDVRGIAIAGTHGKTTTTALVGWILAAGGLDPTVLVGGMSPNFGSNTRMGREDLVVGEADEYDGSFLRLHPTIAIITNVEPEHLDYYGTKESVYDAFRQFAHQVGGCLVTCADDAVLQHIVRGARVPRVTYGIERGDIRARDIVERDGRLAFTVELPEGSHTFEMGLAGLHNVRNAVGAVAVALHLEVEVAHIQAALSSFSGVARRCDIKGEAAGVLVVDDYAHHPTEIAAMLQTFRQRFNRPLRLVFQPHTYSRTAAFLDDFAPALEGADALYLLDIYGARESDTYGMTGEGLAQVISRQNPHVAYAGTADRALAMVVSEARDGDMVVTMGAGDVTKLAPRVLAELAKR